MFVWMYIEKMIMFNQNKQNMMVGIKWLCNNVYWICTGDVKIMHKIRNINPIFKGIWKDQSRSGH